MEEKNKIIKIAVTGPEFSGKSFTAEYLARVFDGWVVPAFDSEYLNHLDRDSTYQDILNIANGQIDVEIKVTADAIKEEVDLIFFDAELIHTKIWAEEKYQKCDEFIVKAIMESDYDHYLLMKPDIYIAPYPVGENPVATKKLFQLYIEYLNHYNKSYTIVQGGLEERLKFAIGIIKTFIV